MDRRGSRPIAVAVMAMGLASPGWTLTSAHAQEDSGSATAPKHEPAEDSALTADALLQRGLELRKASEDRQALADFERAFALGGSVRALAQMALAEQALGLWREAHDHLEQALLKPDDEWISEHRATLEAASLEIASQLGSLEISCNVDDAEVRLNGALLGQTPLTRPVPLVAGANVIAVSKPGYFEMARQVNIDVGRLSRLNVVLTENPSASTSHLGDPPQLPPAPPASAELAAPATSAAGDHGAREGLFYTALGLTALGVTAGVTGYVMREVNVSQYNEDARCSRIEGVRRSNECPEQAAAFQRGEALAIGGFVSAAVFGTTALYLWLTRPAPEREASLVCVPGGAVLACSGRF